SVLEHLKHPSDSKAISEMLRVLRPGGLLIVTTDYEPVKENFVYRKVNEPYNVITLAKTILEPFSDYIENKDNIGIQVSYEEIKKFWTSNWWPESLYDKNLGRNYVAIGFNLRKTNENFKKLTFESSEKEIKSKITEHYEKILKRGVDDEGLEHHYQLIEAGRIKIEELPTVLEMSQEYKNLQKLYAGYALTTEGFGLYLDPLDQVLSKAIALTGIWEPDEKKFFKSIISSGMTIVDVGANIGYFTMLFSKLVGPNGKVVAFEPNPRSYSFLEKNVKSNSLQNIIAVKKAVSDHSGVTKLFLSKNNSTDNRIFDSQIYETDNNREIVDVQVTTLDEHVKDMKVDILKIDVQGAEMTVINGALQTIKNNPNLQIIVEFWPAGLSSNGTKPLQFLKKLDNLGFYTYDLNGSQPLQKTMTELCNEYTDKSFTNLYCIHKQ
ncbi:MAG: FkbM family methyltransferase, partial [Patescibacteria group bacterium]|nr:FkbM family methyltransferase [Patescibacteria group bacterium]